MNCVEENRHESEKLRAACSIVKKGPNLLLSVGVTEFGL